MGYELAKAVLTTIRMNDPLNDMAPALETSISRDTGVHELKVPPIKRTVEEDDGTDLRRYNRLGQWVTDGKVPRPLTFVFKSTPRNIAPQHLAEILKLLQQRFQWHVVKTVTDLQRLDERFFQVCLLSGQGKYSVVMFPHIAEVSCRRQVFGDQSKPIMDMADEAQYFGLEYDTAFHLSKLTSLLAALAHLLAAIGYTKNIVDFGLHTIAVGTSSRCLTDDWLGLNKMSYEKPRVGVHSFSQVQNALVHLLRLCFLLKDTPITVRLLCTLFTWPVISLVGDVATLIIVGLYCYLCVCDGRRPSTFVIGHTILTCAINIDKVI